MSASVLSATDTKPSTTNCRATCPAPGPRTAGGKREKGGRLRVERLDQHTFSKRLPGPPGTPLAVVHVRRPFSARRLESSNPEPDEIGRTYQLQGGEQFCAREHYCGNAQTPREDMDRAAKTGPELEAMPSARPPASVRAAT